MKFRPQKLQPAIIISDDIEEKASAGILSDGKTKKGKYRKRRTESGSFASSSHNLV